MAGTVVAWGFDNPGTGPGRRRQLDRTFDGTRTELSPPPESWAQLRDVYVDAEGSHVVGLGGVIQGIELRPSVAEHLDHDRAEVGGASLDWQTVLKPGRCATRRQVNGTIAIMKDPD